MKASDVTEILDLARAKAGADEVRVVHRPRVLSDNGPCYISGDLATYLRRHGMQHTRGAPYPPQAQGKIERSIGRFVEHCNRRRYHESLDNVTPVDAYHGWRTAILMRREQNKKKTMARRKRQNLRAA